MNQDSAVATSLPRHLHPGADALGHLLHMGDHPDLATQSLQVTPAASNSCSTST